MKKADASGARFALIVGEDEAAANRVAVKPLRGDRRAGRAAAGPAVAAHLAATALNFG